MGQPRFQGLFPGGIKRSFFSPNGAERLAVPPCLLFSECQEVLPLETNDHVRMPTTRLHLVQMSRITGAVPLLPHTPLWLVKDKFILPTEKNIESLLLVSKKFGLDMNAEKTLYNFISHQQNAGKNGNMKIVPKSYEYIANWRGTVTN